MKNSIESPYQRSQKYNELEIKANSIGGNVLYSTEALTNKMNFKKGMRVLDLGAGKLLSSIFMAKEYDVTVWAIDIFFEPGENQKLIEKHGCEDRVFPLKLDARNLPFAENYFDLIICINSYTYFGTDDKYLPYICKFLKQGGEIGITDITFVKEIDNINNIPSFLKRNYDNYWYHIHSLLWWKKKWQKTELVDIKYAKNIDIDNLMKKEYIKYYPDTTREAFADGLKKDKDNLITFFALIGERTSKNAFLEEKFKQ